MSIKEQEHVFIESATGVHHYKIVGSDATGSSGSSSDEKFDQWDEQPLTMGEFKVIPFGNNNDIPKQIQEAFFPNHLAPGVQLRKVELLMEQGPYLYTEQVDGRNYYRQPVQDLSVAQFLESIKYEDVLEHNATEFYYGQIVYSLMRRSRGSRLNIGGSLPIASVEGLSSMNCRLAYRTVDLKEIPTHVIVGDWSAGSNKTEDFEIYPLFDSSNPTRYPASVHISILKSYGVPHYTVPDTFGAIKWIKRSTATPRILEAITENNLSVTYQIESPASYWEKLESSLKKKHGTNYKAKMLKDEETRILKELSDALSGESNIGKFWHNQYVVKNIGANAKEEGWRIKPIESKVGDYIDSYIKISTKADYSVLGALRLHSALANVSTNGKSDSGSEQLYALKIHQLTSTQLAERKVCASLNLMLKTNFPSKNYKIGFYHINAEREQDITASKRVTNQNPTA